MTRSQSRHGCVVRACTAPNCACYKLERACSSTAWASSDAWRLSATAFCCPTCVRRVPSCSSAALTRVSRAETLADAACAHGSACVTDGCSVYQARWLVCGRHWLARADPVTGCGIFLFREPSTKAQGRSHPLGFTTLAPMPIVVIAVLSQQNYNFQQFDQNQIQASEREKQFLKRSK